MHVCDTNHEVAEMQLKEQNTKGQKLNCLLIKMTKNN